MRLLCDESVRLPILIRLTADGHELENMRDIAPSAPDEAVLRIATQLGVPVVTMDVGFARLVFLNRLPVPGVLLLRLHGLTWDEKADKASQAITVTGDRLLGSFVVANRQTVRVRTLPEPVD